MLFCGNRSISTYSLTLIRIIIIVNNNLVLSTYCIMGMERSGDSHHKNIHVANSFKQIKTNLLLMISVSYFLLLIPTIDKHFRDKHNLSESTVVLSM